MQRVMERGLLAASVAGLLLLVLLVGATNAPGESMPGSTESLSLSASEPRSVGDPMNVTVDGVADGSHRLFVYGGHGEHGCIVEHVEAPQQEATLTPEGGEAIPAGSFERHYAAVPSATGRYVVCAYLYAAPARFPDTWEVGCFWVPEGNCYESMIAPWVITSLEEEAKKISEEAEARRAAIRLAEQHAREEEAARNTPEATSANRAAEHTTPALRCRVPTLHGHTLSGARRMLKAAHCRLGKVRVPRRSHGTLRVTSQAPRRGLAFKPNAAVSVTLSSS